VHLRTGALVEKAVLVPLFVVATLGFLYVNTAAHELVDPLFASLG
jgi:hypothetical protein